MYAIGLDTGTHTGIAVWDTNEQKFIYLDTVSIHRALIYVRDMAMLYDVKVYFEDARQRKWIPRERSWKEVKGRAQGAGSVKRDAKIWEDALTDWGIEFESVPPRKGMTKWSVEAFRRVTGYGERTSEHSRDAALLVFGRS